MVAVSPSDDASLVIGDDGQRRCWWCGDDAEYVRYHDTEWGRPVRGDREIFEKLCLEAFQSGLSWLTILRRRAALRARFLQFDLDTLAELSGRRRARFVETALTDTGIIRNRRKIVAVLDNARVARELIARHGSLAAVLDRTPLADHRPPRTRADVPTQTHGSRDLASRLRHAGWRFIGPTSAYAALQALGFVNDHLVGCDTRTCVTHACATVAPRR